MYFILGFMNLLAVALYFLQNKNKLHEYKLNSAIFFLLNLANGLAVVLSKYPIFSFLFWGQLNISYIFIFATNIWIKEISQRKDIKSLVHFYWGLAFVAMYNFTLMILQFITIAWLKNKYLLLPTIVRRILFNGYFLDKVPPQRFDFNSFFIRSTGLMGDTNVNTMLMFAIGIVMLITLLFFVQMPKIAKFKYDKIKNLARLTLPFTILAWFFSFSRSALLGLLVITFVLFIVLFAKKHLIIKKIVKFVSVIAGLLVVLGMLILSFAPVQNYVKEIMNIKANRSIYLHTLYMRQAYNLSKRFKFRPLGLGAFPKLYTECINPKVKEGMSAHSTYFTVLAEQGAFGLAIYLIVFVILWLLFINNLLQTSKKNKKITIYEIAQLSLSAVLPFYTIATIFYYGFWDISVWFWGVHKINKN